MELVLAILMGLGIFLVIPVIIGLSTVGIYLLNRRRVLNTERAGLLKSASAHIENIIEETEHKPISGLPVDGKSNEYIKSK